MITAHCDVSVNGKIAIAIFAIFARMNYNVAQ